MARRIGRRIKDGGLSGIKQDKFRNSRFELDSFEKTPRRSGVREKTPNTIGGAYEENRGRRSASERYSYSENPFEVGKLYNWNKRRGWDLYFDKAYDKEGTRHYGGGMVDHDIAQRGKGPKGYRRPDNSIYEDVCETLTLSPDVDATDIEISVKDGCVYLQGAVESREIKRRAEMEIENISGIKDVQNLLSIRSGKKHDVIRGPEEWERTIHH